MLNVATDLIRGRLDFVDVILLSKMCLFDAENVICENGSAVTLNFVTGGFTGNWETVSGEAYTLF